MVNRSVLNSPRLSEIKRKRRKILMRKTLLWLFLLLAILLGLSFLSRWQKININNIQISGNKVLETKAIESVVKEKISENYLWFFPKTNFILYPKNEIISVLKDKFKRLDNVSLSVKDFKNLEVSLVERSALYTWCGDKPNLQDPVSSEEKCYFLDREGFIFDEAPYFSGEVYLKFYGSVSGLSEQGGDPVGLYFQKLDFKELTSFSKVLEGMKVKPAVFYIEDNRDVRMYLSSLSKSKMGPEIIFKLDANLGEVLENFQSVLTTEPFQSDFKKKYSSLLYIDFRFGNKIYYKFR